MAARRRGIPSGPPDTVVRSCGQAFYHALGDPGRETCTKFHRVGKVLWSKHVIDVQCGGTFTVVRTSNGAVFQWGTLYSYVYPSPTPVLFPAGHVVVQVACGDKHALVATSRGMCMSWGCGLFGRLGLGTHASHATPQPVPVGSAFNVVRVGCGTAHSGAITADGLVYMWGMNNKAQCGGRPCDFLLSPTRLDTRAADDMRPVDITGGRHHSLMLTEEGQVFSWGAASGGRLGYRCMLTEVRSPKRINAFRRSVVTQIASGDFHNVALTEDGIAFTWGMGGDGQCGNPKMVNNLSPLAVEALLPDNLGEGVAFVGAGAMHTFAVTTSGRMYTWGNHDGGLGHGRTVPRLDHALDKYTKARLEDSQLLTPKSVILPAMAKFSGFQREQVVCAGAGKAHTVIVSVSSRRGALARGSAWAPPVAPPPTKPSAKSPEPERAGWAGFVSSDSEPEPDQLEMLQESVRDAFALARAIAQGALFVHTGGFKRASDGKFFATPADALASLVGPSTRAPRPAAAAAAGAGMDQAAGVGSGVGVGAGTSGAGRAGGSRRPRGAKPPPGTPPSRRKPPGKPPPRKPPPSPAGDAKPGPGSPTDPLDSPKYSYMRTETARTIRQRMSARIHEMAAVDAAAAAEEALVADADDAALLLQSCRHGHVDVVNELINSGFPLEVTDDWGNTPLIVACQSNQVPVVVSLLRAGAFVNAQNHKGQTALHYCHKYQFTDLIRLLEQFNADDTVQNAAGLTCYEGLTPADLDAFE